MPDGSINLPTPQNVDDPRWKKTADYRNPGRGLLGFFDTVKDTLTNIVGIAIVATVAIATFIAPQIMIPVLVVYGIWKFADALTTFGDKKPEDVSSFWFWLLLIIIALIVLYFRKK